MYNKPHRSAKRTSSGSSRPSFGRSSYSSSSRPSRSGGNRRNKGVSSLDISEYIRKASQKNAEKPEKVAANKHTTFKEFGLDPLIQANLDVRGYTSPTQIQDGAIPVALSGRDIIGLASTGTGKTAAFLLPLLNKILADRSQKALIMAPTRELALQIEEELRMFAKGSKLSGAVCVGGMPIFRQISELRGNPNFVIGTPGRIKDLSDRGHIDYSQFQNIVLDEVDHMLDMGFIDAITTIMRALPAERQTFFFSATMPERIRNLTSQFLNNPVTIQIAVGSTTKNVEQDVIRVKDRSQKFDMLHDLLSKDDLSKVLIFSETKRDVEQLTMDLQKKGHKAVSIHGDKRQRERARALAQFSDNTMSILVATDVAARGLDIKEITHVINYTVPQSYDDYIHRIGRTGRGNSKGKALTFVH